MAQSGCELLSDRLLEKKRIIGFNSSNFIVEETGLQVLPLKAVR